MMTARLDISRLELVYWVERLDRVVIFEDRAKRWQEQWQRQKQTQIPPLRYGMTTKRAGNSKNNGKSKSRGLRQGQQERYG